MTYQPTSRVLTVLELLQTHGQMTGRDLAARLEVDYRTVRRYIVTLQDMGIPVEAEFGRYGGYALRPGFKLPPLMFTDDEVVVLTLGLLLARRSELTDAATFVESALAKIERVLPGTLRERLRALQTVMQLNDAPGEAQIDNDVLTTLSLATQQQRQVRFRYSETERVFDSYSVIRHQGHWYTVGYCHSRDAKRTFRLDRIQRVELLTTNFTPPPDFDALAYMLASFEAIPDRWQIEVLLKMSLDAARQRVPRELATLTQAGDQVRLQSSMPDLDEMARWMIGLGCPLTIINPPELREAFLKIAAEITQIALAPTNS
jgi:predicted DNA-binding transcriptional regulator YafY